MLRKKKRVILILPDDVEAAAENIKHDLFCDKSDSEMYRQLIRMGLDTLNLPNRLRDEAMGNTQDKKTSPEDRGHENNRFEPKLSMYGWLGTVK